MEKQLKFERYPEYKDSGVEWLGDVPQNWIIKKVKHVIKEHSGNGFPIHLQGSNNLEVPFYKVSDINGKDDFLTVSNNYVSRSIIKQNGWNYVPKYSIITAKIGEALRKNHRKIVLNECIIDNNCIALEAKKIDIKYNYYIHKIIDFDWFTNAGAVPSISVEKYKNSAIIIPPIEEQKRIAEFLDKKTAQIEQAISQKQQLIELLKERRQIVIHNAVTRGLNPDAPMKPSGIDWIGEIPAHWKVKKLKHLTTCLADKVISKHSTRTYVGMENIESWTGKYLDNNIEADGIASRFETGDILFGKLRPYLAKVMITKFSGICSTELLVYRPTKEIKQEYLFQLMISYDFIKMVDSSTYGAKMPRANSEFIGNLLTPLPPISEQQKIVEYLDKVTTKIEAAITCKQNEIEKLKEYKATLINSAVTGKIKVFS